MTKANHEANRHDKSAKRVAAAPAPPLNTSLQHDEQHGFVRQKKRRILETLVALGLMLGLALLAFFMSGLAAEQLTRWIPLEIDIKLGRTYAQSMKASGRVCPHAAGQQALREFAAPLVSEADAQEYPFEFHLVQDNEPNAYALPGGQVMVTQALVQEVESSDELAGVIAHEIQHIKLRHSMKAVMRQLGTNAVLSLLLGGSSTILENLGATRLVELSYGREAEREADLQGALRLQELGYHPSAFTRLLKRMSQGSLASMPTILSSHPRSDEREGRLANLQAPPPSTTGRGAEYLDSIKCYPNPAKKAEPLSLE